MDTPTPSRWTPIAAAGLKGLIVAAVLAGLFLVMPGKWDWRITLVVAAVFGLFSFVTSLLSTWAHQKVTDHLSKGP